MGFIQDFKEFAAVAGVVKSFLENIITPLIAVVAGVPDMSSMKHPIGDMIEVTGADGVVKMEQAAIKYGVRSCKA